jgi:leader peptidase (prepilin peptidase)/N-methyltransferase
VKLLAMIGAWLGVKSILLVIVISSLLGSVVGILFMVVRGKDFKTAIPFGPFLAAGALAYVFWGSTIQGFLTPPMP